MIDNTPDQDVVIKSVENFLVSDDNLMIITGAAGTGKTTLIKNIQDIALERNWKTIPLGVWGRSVGAIIQITGIPAISISKYIRIHDDIERKKEPYKNFEDWYTSFYSRKFKIKIFPDFINKLFSLRDEIDSTLLVIDEASTLNYDTLKKAYELTKKNNKNVKIIILGDNCQLPPTKSSDNILELGFFETEKNDLFNVFNEEAFELKTSHRVDDEQKFLLELTRELRPLAEERRTSEEAKEIIREAFNSQEVLVLSKKNCFKKLKEINNIKEVMYIAPENEATVITKALRNNYLSLDGGGEEIIIEGDFLRARANGAKQDFVTGDEFIVKKILDDTEEFIIAKVEAVSRIKEYRGKLVRDALLLIVNTFWEQKTREAIIAIYKPPLSNDNLFKRTNYLRAAYMNAWEDLSKEELSSDLFNNIDDVIAVSYGYASKIQDVQGGEWDHVALSLTTDEKIDNARYWYTAVTRAKKQLLVVIN